MVKNDRAGRIAQWVELLQSSLKTRLYPLDSHSRRKENRLLQDVLWPARALWCEQTPIDTQITYT